MAKKRPPAKPASRAVPRPQATPTAENTSKKPVLTEPVVNDKPVSHQKPVSNIIQSSVAQRIVIWLAGGLGVGLMLVVLIRYGQYLDRDAINAPFGDDYRATLNFLVEYLQPKVTWSKRLEIIFGQHNEHRIVFNKLIVLADYYRLGIVNFRDHILFANTSLLVILGLLFAVSLRKEPLPLRLLLFAPVGLILFQPSYWETQIWAMAALQNLYVVAFAMSSLFFLGSQKLSLGRFAGASCFALIATFTSGNGILVFIAGIAWLLLTKQWKWLAVWCLVMAIGIVIYFYGYIKPADSPDIADSLLKNPARAFEYLFTLLGSFTSIVLTKTVLVGQLLLVLFLGLFGVGVVQYYHTKQLPPLSLLFLVFIYLTAASLMAGRSGFGALQAYSPRYGLIPVLIIALSYLLIVELLPRRSMRVGVGLAFGLLAYWLNTESFRVNLLQAEDRVGQLRYNGALYADNRQNRVIMPANDTKDAKPIYYEQAEAMKLYTLDVFSFDQIRPVLRKVNAGRLVPSTEIMADVKPYDTGKYIVVYNAWAFLIDRLADKSTTYLVAQSPVATYEVPTERRIRFDIANQYQQPSLRFAGFATILRKADLPKGTYQLGIRIQNENISAYAPIETSLSIN